jgi:hypothetical protein
MYQICNVYAPHLWANLLFCFSGASRYLGDFLVNKFLSNVHGGCHPLTEDAYYSMAPDPNFGFSEVCCALRLLCICSLRIVITSNTLLTSPIDIFIACYHAKIRYCLGFQSAVGKYIDTFLKLRITNCLVKEKTKVHKFVSKRKCLFLIHSSILRWNWIHFTAPCFGFFFFPFFGSLQS